MEYIIKLSQRDIQVLLQGLGELQMKTALATLGSLQSQVQAQDAANAMPIADLEKQIKK